MKVISGLYKGRKIDGYDIDGTRPTMDRVKESIFGSIQNYVPDSIILDLFAGSGNLGIEAISNGAKYGYFVDNNKIAYNTIITNNIVMFSNFKSFLIMILYEIICDITIVINMIEIAKNIFSPMI